MKKTNYIVFGVLALALLTLQSPKLAFADDIVLPTVETVSYDSNSVNLRGNLIDMGGATTVNVGFELGTTTAYGIIVNNSVSTLTTTGEWTDGPPVTCSTTYHFRAFASNDAGTAYGADMTFDTVVCPYAQTDVETSVTETGATLNGTLPGLGFVPPVGVYFEYSSDPSMSSPIITPTITLSAVGAFSQSITGLSCGTYYFRAVSTDGVNPFHTGVLRSFMTCPPVVTTSPAQYTSITSTRLIGSFQPVINNDYLVSPFFEYGTTIAYGTTVTADGVFTIAGGDMKADMYNLACGTEYHYRAGGTNIRGTGYGDDMTFTTLACDMAAGGIFIVTGASAITETSATLSGELVSLGSGGPATISFDYGTTSSYGTTVTLPGTNHVPHESYSTTLTGLSCGTTYYYSNTVVFSAGPGGDTGSGTTISDGVNLLSFTTSACPPPLVSTIAATDITRTSAILGGVITSVQWTESPIELGIKLGDTSIIVDGNLEQPATFAHLVENLSCDTTYTYFAYATNGSVTHAGEDMTFTTLPCASSGGSGSPKLICDIDGDLNKDCTVDMLDYILLMSMWGDVQTGNLADLNQDDTVDALDLVVLMFNWSK